MRNIWIVAHNTTKEILRDKVLYGLFVFALFLIFCSLLLGQLSFAEQARIVTDLGLVATQVGCGMLSVFVGSSLVWKEIERQTVLTLLSKPVSRAKFLIGKFLGLGLVIILVDILISTVLALLIQNLGDVHWYQFIVAEIGALFESLFLLSVAIFFGVFCRPIMTTVFTLSIWVLGHGINDLHYFSQKSPNEIFKAIGLGISKFFPNLDYFNFKEAVIYGDAISSLSITRAFGIWIAWFIILSIASTWIFEKRDFT